MLEDLVCLLKYKYPITSIEAGYRRPLDLMEAAHLASLVGIFV
jgi:hypothetical protein